MFVLSTHKVYLCIMFKPRCCATGMISNSKSKQFNLINERKWQNLNFASFEKRK